MIWDTCTQRKPDVLGFEVTNVKEYDYFTPVVKVYKHCTLASVSNGMKNRDNFWKRGYFW